MPTKVITNKTNIYKLLNASFQGSRRLFVLAYDATHSDNAGKQIRESISSQNQIYKTITC